MYIPHPARQGDDVSLMDWLRFYVGTWMQTKGAQLEHRALWPADVRCPDCGQWMRPDGQCDHIPF